MFLYLQEIYKDRKKFSKQVFEVASSDLVNMGITVVSYTLKDIRDDEGYLKALGMARTAEVKRDARIGEADAKRDAQIKEAIAEEERLAARLANDIEIAKAQRDFELKKAAYDAEVQTKVRSIGWGLGGGRGPLARRSRKPCSAGRVSFANRRSSSSSLFFLHHWVDGGAVDPLTSPPDVFDLVPMFFVTEFS